MISILKQEFKSNQKRILISATVLFCILLAGILVNVTAHNSGSDYMHGVGEALYFFCLFIATIGMEIYCIAYGPGNMIRKLRSDESYLMLLIPRKSYQIIAGKLLINLMELCIYAIISFLMLSLLGPLAGVIFKGTDFQDLLNLNLNIKQNYWESVKGLYYALFVSNLPSTMRFVVSNIVIFFCYQIVFDFSAMLYTSLIKNKKNKIVMTLIMLAVIYAVGRFTTMGTGKADDILSSWIVIGRFVFCAVILFAGTCLLMEKKLEV